MTKWNPPQAGVYRAFAPDGTLLYIGASGNVHHRMYLHSRSSWWVGAVARWEVHPTATAGEARAVEAAALVAEHPRWNMQGRGVDHPDGCDLSLDDIAARYPGDLTRPAEGTAAARAFDARFGRDAAAHQIV